MGKPFEGMGLFGFDNIKGQYETLWLDNMGTGFVRGTGTYEASTKVLKDTGEYSCPISQNKTRAYRAEWKLIDKTHTVYEMWSTTPEGTEYKQMEMAYLRTK